MYLKRALEIVRQYLQGIPVDSLEFKSALEYIIKIVEGEVEL